MPKVLKLTLRDGYPNLLISCALPLLILLFLVLLMLHYYYYSWEGLPLELPEFHGFAKALQGPQAMCGELLEPRCFCSYPLLPLLICPSPKFSCTSSFVPIELLATPRSCFWFARGCRWWSGSNVIGSVWIVSTPPCGFWKNCCWKCWKQYPSQPAFFQKSTRSNPCIPELEGNLLGQFGHRSQNCCAL